MKKKLLYQALRQRMDLVCLVPPQQLGFFTPYWKTMAAFLKNNFFYCFLLVSLIISLLLWFFQGTALVKLVSLLQAGF